MIHSFIQQPLKKICAYWFACAMPELGYHPCKWRQKDRVKRHEEGTTDKS